MIISIVIKKATLIIDVYFMLDDGTRMVDVNGCSDLDSSSSSFELYL